MNKTTNIKTLIRLDMISLLFIVFLILKLMDEINWSWWWVTSPLWIPFTLILPIYVILKIKKK